jgi:glycosyltransferase involved in cell wall biosynthesis
MSIRIGVNALYLLPGAVGGTEIYIRSLLQALAAIDPVNQYYVYVNRETGNFLAPQGFHTVQCPVTAAFRPARIIYEQTAFYEMLRRHRIDVLLNPGYTAPLFAGCPQVSVFHDLQHKKHPEFFRWHHLPFWNLLLWVSAKRSARILTVSEATAADLVEWMPAIADKMSVIPHGADSEFFRAGEDRLCWAKSTKPYILSVSTLHPHKNIERLLESFALFRKDRPDYRLVLAGMRGFASARIQARALALDLGDAVVFTGWLRRDKLYSLFEEADAFIAPTLFEGFGLTVLEAMAAGLPLACSDIEPLRSLTLGAAHHFDPHSVREMADALERITSDEVFRTRAAHIGPELASNYSWIRTAAATLRELVSISGRRDLQSSRETALPLPPR